MNRIKIFISMLIVFGLAACSSATTQAPPSTTTTPKSSEIPTEPVSEIMPDIAQHGLTGRLVLIQYNADGNRLIELNLESGEVRTLFQAPDNSWLSEALVSPNAQQILLTYAPPPPGNETQFGYTDLYLLPYDGSSQPQPFITRSDPQEAFFFSDWASDSQSVYFTHLFRVDPDSEISAYQNDIERATLRGEAETIIEHALWPAISPDGTKLSYLNAGPGTFNNDLYLAKPDGSDQIPVLQPGANSPVDAHLFTMDGDQLIFSMVNLQPAPASTWLEKLFGVEVASAHNVPSDWYRVSLSGGVPQRLTNLNDVNLNGDLSPDGSQLAFIGASGLYVMNIDGGNLIRLSSNVLVGTVDWIP